VSRVSRRAKGQASAAGSPRRRGARAHGARRRRAPGQVPRIGIKRPCAAAGAIIGRVYLCTRGNVAAPGRASAEPALGIRYHRGVSNLRIRQAAELLGVSDDTVRRWINQGALEVDHDAAGRKVIASEYLAHFSRNNAPAPPADPLSIGSSARNRFVGLVTAVVSDKVMTQVEMQCGPFTVVSLMSTEAAEELQLRPGSVAVAVVKATTVIVETAQPSTTLASD
jgi:molybdopterin-binding protein